MTEQYGQQTEGRLPLHPAGDGPARPRRPVLPGGSRRGLSGLGLLIVVAGLIYLAVTYALLPPSVYRLWPVLLVGLGVFGLLRRPGWVTELDLSFGPNVGRAADAPRRWFSVALIVIGVLALLFSVGLVDQRIFGPMVVVGVGVLLIWRRAR